MEVFQEDAILNTQVIKKLIPVRESAEDWKYFPFKIQMATEILPEHFLLK